MTSRDQTILGQDGRAVSEVVGYTLLVGIVSVTIIALLVGAMTVQSGIQDQLQSETEQKDLQKIEQSFGGLAHGDNRTSLNVRTRTSNGMSVVRNGEVTIEVNDNCQWSHDLSSIRYENTENKVIAYEAGGIFRITEAGVSTSSPPALHYENGTIDLSISNITGRTASSMTMVRNASSSTKQTNQIDSTLFAGSCSKPDNITVSITSDYAEAWDRYMKSEFPSGTVSKSSDTVTVNLKKHHFPDEADLRRNTVVNFTNTSQFTINPPSLTIDKPDDSNVYRGGIAPIQEGMQLTRIDLDDQNTTVFRNGFDVVLVLDKSGSMVDAGYDNWDDSGDSEKIDDLQTGAKDFVGMFNASMDRAGIVWYDHRSRPFPSDGNYITSDKVALNNTIAMENNDFGYDVNSSSLYGSTYMNRGLGDMLTMYDLLSQPKHYRYAILLSDGNNVCTGDWGICSYGDDNEDNDVLDDAAKTHADRAEERGIKIFTIGYGSNADEPLLQEIANRTGGDYEPAGNEDELNAAFEAIFNNMTETKKKIVYDPASMKLSSENKTFSPFVPGNMEYLANDSQGFVNINDPAIPHNFTYAFSVDDGEPINFTAFDYDCDDWQLTSKTVSNNSSSNKYFVTRCRDINESSKTNISAKDLHVYTNADNISNVEDNFSNSAWYQTNISKVLDPYANHTTGKLNLSSNQALLAVNYSSGQRMILLLEIGKSELSNDLTHIVDVQIDNVEVKEKDEQNS
jgi:hypothetical protein